jgi:hypothetical protein
MFLGLANMVFLYRRIRRWKGYFKNWHNGCNTHVTPVNDWLEQSKQGVNNEMLERFYSL